MFRIKFLINNKLWSEKRFNHTITLEYFTQNRFSHSSKREERPHTTGSLLLFRLHLQAPCSHSGLWHLFTDTLLPCLVLDVLTAFSNSGPVPSSTWTRFRNRQKDFLNPLKRPPSRVANHFAVKLQVTSKEKFYHMWNLSYPTHFDSCRWQQMATKHFNEKDTLDW